MESLGFYGRSFVDYNPESTDRGCGQFRALSYNVYSDAKCRAPEVRHTTTKAWSMRGPKLVEEIVSYDADILMLQDVDHFRDHWQPKLAGSGYDSLYMMKTEYKGRRAEGVVIAYKRDNFQLFKSAKIELNKACDMRADISTEVYDSVQNDDVAIIAFLQPWKEDYLTSAICVVSAMTSDIPGPQHSLVRALEIEYLTHMIEQANQEFQLPVLLGVSLCDEPSSPAYHILRTGRAPIRPELPRQPKQPTVQALSRSSVRIFWTPPRTSIADPPVLGFKICWRPGGSTTLSFRTEKKLSIAQCIQYVKRRDASGIMRTVSLDTLAYTLVGLVSEMPYEFKVCAVNEVGQGVWSTATPVIVLKAAGGDKVPAMPTPVWLKSIEDVYQLRENMSMKDGDFDAAKSSSSHENSATHLTPRLITGDVDVQPSRARVLPLSTNARSGWDTQLCGGGSQDLTSFLNMDKRLRSSLLRDMEGNFTAQVSDTSDGRYARLIESEEQVTEYEQTMKERLFQEDEAIQRARIRNNMGGKPTEEEVDVIFDESIKDASSSLLWSSSSGQAGQGHAQAGLLESVSEAVPDTDQGLDQGHQVGQGGIGIGIGIGGDREVEGDGPEFVGGGEGREDMQPSSSGSGPAVPGLALERSLETKSGMREGSGPGISVSFNLEADDDDDEDRDMDRDRDGSVSGMCASLDALSVAGADAVPGTQASKNKSKYLSSHASSGSLSRGATVIQRFLDDGFTQLGERVGDEAGRESLREDDDVLLDGAHVVKRLGIPDMRQMHTLNLRSAYERYSVAGEPTYTFSQPDEGDHCAPPRGVACMDYIFYSQELLKPRRVATIPALGMLGPLGDDPREPLYLPDPCLVTAPSRLADSFAATRLGKKMSDLTGRGGTDSSDHHAGEGHGHHVTDKELRDCKTKLKTLLKNPNATKDVHAGTYVPPVCSNALRGNSSLPNVMYCSSHIALVAEFNIADNGSLAVAWR